jgi:hypothetical protein
MKKILLLLIVTFSCVSFEQKEYVFAPGPDFNNEWTIDFAYGHTLTSDEDTGPQILQLDNNLKFLNDLLYELKSKGMNIRHQEKTEGLSHISLHLTYDVLRSTTKTADIEIFDTNGEITL